MNYSDCLLCKSDKVTKTNSHIIPYNNYEKLLLIAVDPKVITVIFCFSGADSVLALC